jgi:hypothetical protein
MTLTNRMAAYERLATQHDAFVAESLARMARRLGVFPETMLDMH